MFDPKHIALHQALIKQAEGALASVNPATWKMLLAGGAGAIGGGSIAHLATRALDEKEREATRNNAFGAGVATGVAGPHIVRGLFNIAENRGLIAPPPEGVP